MPSVDGKNGPRDYSIREVKTEAEAGYTYRPTAPDPVRVEEDCYSFPDLTGSGSAVVDLVVGLFGLIYYPIKLAVLGVIWIVDRVRK